MTPRRLKVSVRAAADLRRRASFLSRERGGQFARKYVDRLLDRLGRIAEGGAVLGTARGDDHRLRTFGYESQATILAYFAEKDLEIVRVFFKGQDWQRESR